MTRSPTVSVLLTAYNRERYIASSIESVLGQTYGDFELLIADNCSTDGTLEIARGYERDPRVRIVVNERNLGQFGNRNRAAELARGSLLKYHDSDDLMYPHCLAVMVSMLLSEPRAGFGLSSGWAWSGGACPMLLTPRMAYQREYLGDGTLFSCGPSGAIFRTGVFRDLGGFVDEGAPSDYYFWMRACTRVNVVLLPADLFWYRLHPSQELRSNKAQLEYSRAAGAAWRALDAPECPLTRDEREQAKRNRTYHLAKRTYEDVRSGRWPNAWRRLRASGQTGRDWLTYLRRPQRDAMAGTPLDAAGEFAMPPWLSEPPR